MLEVDESGYNIADESTETAISGVYAAGDVRIKPLWQMVTAMRDSAAASHAEEADQAAED